MDKPDGETGRTLREIAIDAVAKNIDFYPDWGKSRLGGMLESRPDWCVSRQRSWGLPLPYFTDGEGRAVMTVKMVAAVSERIREKGSDVWFFSEPLKLLSDYDPKDDPEAPDWLRSKEDMEKLLKGGDVFDVWFESGSSWNSVLRARDLGYPADMYLEGSDQHRGWFQSSLLVALGATGKSPFRALFTHGFMVDARGRKMSKSGGNAIDVEDILGRYGADVCRWWVSSLSYSNDIKVDWEFFDVAADEYRKIRNTIRFLLGNLSDFDPEQDAVEMDEEDRYSIDRWAHCEFTRFAEETSEAYSGFQYKKASDLLFSFCSNEMSAVYLACVKDRLYCERKDSRKRRRSQTVMYEIAEGIIKFLAPILVHTSYEAWKSLRKDPEANVHLEEFPRVRRVPAEGIWSDVMDIRKRCLKALEEARGEGCISNPLDASVHLTVGGELLSEIKKFEGELEDLCGVSRFRVTEGDEILVELTDISSEPRCERSWKRGETVRKRQNGNFLSERDALALGL
ncbi:MAG: class I tRNA ligase family protein, partial [Candidatus Dadabacteria bacterium]|nr:class I tRNA ligase family protein [Candidatus Dadabacteria bacterium]